MMVFNVIQVHARRLLHNRVELLLTFVVPVAFFSIFAVIFGGGLGSARMPKVKVALVDESAGTSGRAVEAALRQCSGLRFMTQPSDPPLNREQASAMVREGKLALAIVVTEEGQSLAAELLADSSDQVAPQVVSALVARALLTAFGPSQTAIPDNPVIQASMMQPIDPAPSPSVQVVDVIGENKTNPVVSMYAAGIAVMFLLFGAAGGGGALLEERENRTLERLLSTQMTMDQLLLGKWFYHAALGVVQVSVMFVWGQLLFDVDLSGHLDGFLIITTVTALAAAGFGLFLATLCKSRGQLNGLSVVLILTMSALGGSMVPRYLMSQRMQDAGMWTFNAWALDGYNKIFWRDMPVSSLTPQLIVLMASGLVFLILARMLALRWEFD